MGPILKSTIINCSKGISWCYQNP